MSELIASITQQVNQVVHSLPIPLNVFNIILQSTIIAPHLLYAAAWYFRSIFKNHIRGFQNASMIIRVLSVLSMALIGFTNRPDVCPISPPAWLLCLVLLTIGQSLNSAVYKTLGVDGVYYGRELGIIPPDAPYVKGFPYVIPHPQYVGACLSVLAGVLALGVCSDPTSAFGVQFVTETWKWCAYIFCLYGVTITIEH